MPLPTPVRFALPLSLAIACSAAGRAQQLIGYVPTRDANVTGATDELDGNAVLSGSVVVTAKDHTAPITLGRGGTVQVCQTSVLHLTESREVTTSAPLLFSLDRGAIQIQTTGTPNDAIMTPDLRLTVRSAGPLDLRLRVARNGDTCVDNRGAGAPTLAVSDPFGTEMYELNPGQHVLFEHGSVHDVVDRESSPCGCPDAKGESLADALLTPTPKPAIAAQVAAEHPFPAAISEGLAPPAAAPPPATAETPPPVGEALVYNGATKDPDALPPQDQVNPAGSGVGPQAAPRSATSSKSNPEIAAAALAPAPTPAPKPAPAAAAKGSSTPAQPPDDFVHLVGHFFHKLFGRH